MSGFWTANYSIDKRLFGYAWEVSTTGHLVLSIRGWHRRKVGAEAEARETMRRVCDVLLTVS